MQQRENYTVFLTARLSSHFQPQPNLTVRIWAKSSSVKWELNLDDLTFQSSRNNQSGKER